MSNSQNSTALSIRLAGLLYIVPLISKTSKTYGIGTDEELTEKSLVMEDTMFFSFVEVGNNSISIKRPIRKDEYDLLMTCHSRITKMQNDYRRIEPFTSAIKRFDDACASLSTGDRIKTIGELEHSFSEILFTFRKYLDNWETDLLRNEQICPGFYKIFKDAQANEYDKHKEYQILYRLRNYDQHCGNILSTVKGVIDEQGNHVYKVMAKRSDLLEKFNKWKKEDISFLELQDEYIDMNPYICLLQKSVTQIHNTIMKMHFNRELYSSCAQIVLAANEFPNEDVVGIIVSEQEMDKDFWTQDSKSVRIIYLEVPLCKRLIKRKISSDRNFVCVLYNGDHLAEQLSDCAIKISDDIAHKISINQVIQIGDEKMLRLICTIMFDKGELYAVLAKINCTNMQIRNLTSDYSMYLKAICKETH